MEKQSESCLPKPTLEERALLSSSDAQGLESIFKLLSSASRLRLIHAIALSRELCVGELANTLDMKQSAISNQLKLLSDKGIVKMRRDGLYSYYSIEDPCVLVLLERGWCLTEEAQARQATSPQLPDTEKVSA